MMSAENSSGSTFLHAKAANESIKAQKSKRQLAKLEKRYIDRQQVEQMVLHVLEENRNQWLLWPGRVSHELAAQLHVDTKLLEDTLYQGVLQHFAELGDLHFSLEEDLEEN